MNAHTPAPTHTHTCFASHWIDIKLSNKLMQLGRNYWHALTQAIADSPTLPPGTVFSSFVGELLTIRVITEDYDEGCEVAYYEFTCRTEQFVRMSFVVPIDRVTMPQYPFKAKQSLFTWQDKRLVIEECPTGL